MVYCEECRRFQSDRGLLVRAFECEYGSVLHGWNVPLSNQFSAPRDGWRLLENATKHDIASFQRCGEIELSGVLAQRPVTALRADMQLIDQPTHASNFGLTLAGTAAVAGACEWPATLLISVQPCDLPPHA